VCVLSLSWQNDVRFRASNGIAEKEKRCSLTFAIALSSGLMSMYAFFGVSAAIRKRKTARLFVEFEVLCLLSFLFLSDEDIILVSFLVLCCQMNADDDLI
jgi:hypothetical protein